MFINQRIRRNGINGMIILKHLILSLINRLSFIQFKQDLLYIHYKYDNKVIIYIIILIFLIIF